jgi:hypothetical protein
VLVNIQEHIDRLVAARLQADIMGAETIIVARTDGEAANLLGASILHFHCPEISEISESSFSFSGSFDSVQGWTFVKDLCVLCCDVQTPTSTPVTTPSSSAPPRPAPGGPLDSLS